MLKNMNYNLLEEIAQKSKSLYRYDLYVKDAQSESPECQGCIELWNRLKQREEEDLNQLMQHFKSHIDQGVVQFGTERKMAV